MNSSLDALLIFVYSIIDIILLSYLNQFNYSSNLAIININSVAFGGSYLWV